MKKHLGNNPLPQFVAVTCLALLAPLGLGLALDHLFGTAPLGLLICAAIGMLAATAGVVRITTRRMAALVPPATSAGDQDVASDEGSNEREGRA